MGWLYNLLTIYLTTAALLIHCSLFYCSPYDCAVGFTKSPLPPFADRLIHSLISALPVEIRVLQAIAQLLLIGDLLFLLLMVLKFIGSILKYLCLVVLIVGLVMGGLYFYAEYQHRKGSIGQGWGSGWS